MYVVLTPLLKVTRVSQQSIHTDHHSYDIKSYGVSGRLLRMCLLVCSRGCLPRLKNATSSLPQALHEKHSKEQEQGVPTLYCIRDAHGVVQRTDQETRV